MSDQQFFFWGCVAFACAFALLFKTSRLLHKIERTLEDEAKP